MRIKHRKHNRWKRHSLSTHRYYLYDTKERCSRIGIKRHLRKLYQHPFLLQRAGSIIACSAASTSDPNHPSQVSFDTDSFIIGDDNHTPHTLSNNKHHFIGFIRKLENVYIHWFNGRLPIRGIGTVQWKIGDEDDKVHTFCIPNTFMFHNWNITFCHLNTGLKKQMIIFRYRMKQHPELLRWSQGRYKRTVMMDPATNTPRLRSAAFPIAWSIVSTEIQSWNHKFMSLIWLKTI